MPNYFPKSQLIKCSVPQVLCLFLEYSFGLFCALGDLQSRGTLPSSFSPWILTGFGWTVVLSEEARTGKKQCLRTDLPVHSCWGLQLLYCSSASVISCLTLSILAFQAFPAHQVHCAVANYWCAHGIQVTKKLGDTWRPWNTQVTHSRSHDCK